MQKIGLGTAAIGRPEYINLRIKPKNFSDLKGFESHGLNLLETAYEHGIRYFDTAPGYGMAEDLLLAWLKNKPYNDVEVATKWGYKYVADFKPNARIHEIKEHSLQLLNAQWAKSKNILPHLSTLQIHSATFETGVLKNRAILARLHEIKIKHNLKIGLTSSGTNQTEVLNYALDIMFEGTPLFEVFQATYNILDQSLASNHQNFKGRRLVIKEALANGRILPYSGYTNYQDLYHTLEALADKYETSPDAIALRFCVDSIGPFMVLSGASEKTHLVHNIKANSFQLEEEDVVLLRSFGISTEKYWSERKQLVWN